jgi:hypothetical protein
MAAPEGNQFWKLRSKHGRDKLFKTPQALWEAACEYFQWCDDNPLMASEQRKGTVVIPKNFEGEMPDALVELPRMRPYTLTGLCIYLDCNSAYFRQFKADETRCTKDFATVISRVEDVIYTQKFEGAAAGFLNHNIIARDLGLRDNKDVTTDGEKIGKYDISLKLDGPNDK